MWFLYAFSTFVSAQITFNFTLIVYVWGFYIAFSFVILEYDLHLTVLNYRLCSCVYFTTYLLCAVVQKWLWRKDGFCPHFCCVLLQVVAVTLRQTVSSRWLTTRRISVTGGRYPSPPSPAPPLTSSFQLKINHQATFLHHWERNALSATRTVATAGPAAPLRMTTRSPGTVRTHTMASHRFFMSAHLSLNMKAKWSGVLEL